MERPLLLIIARGDTKRHAFARRLFGGWPGVEIVFDRRVGERRASHAMYTVHVEHRQRERRSYDVTPELSSTGWASGRRSDGTPGLSLPNIDALTEAFSQEGSWGATRPQRIRSAIQRRPSIGLLVGILVAALVLRGYWVAQHSAMLEENGSAYARIAENLVEHGTYVGLSEGPELLMPPLFPMLLALGSLVAGSVDGAARLVPWLAGVLLVLTAFALAQLMYGPRVALGTAALTALHPLLIDLSSTAYSEGVYLPLKLGGLYWGLRALDSGRPAHMMWCGTLLGLMYLTRPEAVFCAVVVLAGALLTDLRRPAFVKRFALHALSLLAPIVILAAPYAAYLSMHTGSLSLEGKGVLNFTIGERRNSGMSHAEAALGIGPDLSEDGPLLSPSVFVATNQRSLSVREITDYWIRSARRNKAPVFELLASAAYGSVLAMGLVVLGLFRRPWDHRRAVREGVLLTVAFGDLFLLFGLHVVLARYMLALVPLWLLWISKGIDETARWAVYTARRMQFRWRLPTGWLDPSIRGVMIAAVLALALWGARWGPLEDQGPKTLLLKDVGIWLDHYRPGPKHVMTRHGQIVYYSRGTWIHMPYAEASLAVRYVHRKHPDFIVLIGDESYFAPYLEQWLKEGIPDPAATLIYRSAGASPSEVAIYEWRN
jgi:4-amino-4-deoxy-L-arabinose transferase-like glycosyltransferase